MINRVVLVGRLGADPELRNTSTGNSVCSFVLGVDSRTKNPDGTKGKPYWIPCVVFSQQAENVAKSIFKGSLVGIEGRLSQRSYERKEGGGKVNVIEVICDSVQFLEPKDKRTSSTTPTFDDTPAQEEPSFGDTTMDIDDDDLPF